MMNFAALSEYQAAATQSAKSVVLTFVDRNLSDLGGAIDHEIPWWYGDGDWILWRPLTSPAY